MLSELLQTETKPSANRHNGRFAKDFNQEQYQVLHGPEGKQLAFFFLNEAYVFCVLSAVVQTTYVRCRLLHLYNFEH